MMWIEDNGEWIGTGIEGFNPYWMPRITLNAEKWLTPGQIERLVQSMFDNEIIYADNGSSWWATDVIRSIIVSDGPPGKIFCEIRMIAASAEQHLNRV